MKELNYHDLIEVINKEGVRTVGYFIDQTAENVSIAINDMDEPVMSFSHREIEDIVHLARV